MTRLLLIALLVLSRGPVYAEWVSVVVIDHDDKTIFVDADTIRHKGDMVMWWELHDFKTAQTVGGSPYFSQKVQREFDCTEKLVRVLVFTEFSGNMGSGNMVYFSSPNTGKWQPIEPHSLGQTLWKVACNKK